jgi:hypothetical protein
MKSDYHEDFTNQHLKKFNLSHPPILYHYTNNVTADLIIKNKQMRAYEILNQPKDQNEFLEGYRLFQKVFKNHTLYNSFPNFLSFFDKEVLDSKTTMYFISSFTVKKKSIFHFKRFTRNSRRVKRKFNLELSSVFKIAPKHITVTNGVPMAAIYGGHVNYSRKKQEKIYRKMLNTYELLKNKIYKEELQPDHNQSLGMLGLGLLQTLIFYCTTYKRFKFFSEKEYRLVVTTAKNSNSTACNHGSRQYVEVDILYDVEKKFF